jgi:hypothetical protein
MKGSLKNLMYRLPRLWLTSYAFIVYTVKADPSGSIYIEDI